MTAALRDRRACASPTPTGSEALAASTSTVGAGERVAVLGPNGAGKTTLVLHLNGILRPQRRRRSSSAGCRSTKAQPRRDPPAGRHRVPGPRRPAVHADGPRRRRLRSGQPRAARRRARRPGRTTPSTPSAWPSTPTGRRTTSASASAAGSRSPPCWPWSPTLLVLDEPTSNLDPAARRELADVLAALDAHDARRHPRPALRPRAVPAVGDPRRRAHRRRRPHRRAPRRRDAARRPPPRAPPRLRPEARDT